MYHDHMKKVQLHIPELLIARLQALAGSTGIRWQEHVRAAVLEYLKQKEEK